MILTITLNPSVDASSGVDHVVPEHKLRCEEPSFEPGGGGINVSRAIKRLGGESLALYTSGGPYGQMLERLLDAEGVRHQSIPIAELTRENLIVEETSSGQQFRFNMPGPHLEEKEWRACLDAISATMPAPDYIVASGSLPPGAPGDFYARVAKIAKARHARLILDTFGEALWLTADSGVYLIKPNVRELQELTQQEIRNEAQLEDAARELIKKEHCEVAIISLGAAGALRATRGECEIFRAPIVPVKSVVGAGDSMVAGIVLSLSRGKQLREAVLFGMAAGAAAVMNSRRELCRLKDAEDLFQGIVTAAPPARP